MSIVIKKPWTRQPQTPVGIDRSNPLAKGLVLAINPANGALLNSVTGSFNSTASGVATTVGVDQNGKNITQAGAGFVYHRSRNLTSKVYTCIIAVNVESITNAWAGIFSIAESDGTATTLSMQRYSSSDNLAFYINTADALNVVDELLSIVGQGLQIIAVTHDAANLTTYYRNGVFVQSGTTGTPDTLTDPVASLFSSRDLNTSYTGTGRFSNVLCYDRVLTATEIAKVSSNLKDTWQLYAPQRRMLYGSAAAVGGSFQSAWAIGSNQIIQGGVQA